MDETRPGFDARSAAARKAWRALGYFNLYRVFVSGLFALLSLLGSLPPNFTKFDIELFSLTACGYLVFAVASQIAIQKRVAPLAYQVNALVLVDTIAIILFMHASGGVRGGFGILLVVSIAGTCLLATWRAAVFFAALATLAVLGETLFGILYLDYEVASYTQAGLLGAAFFGTAILASTLAEQARRSEALAAQRAVDIERLSRLNEHIVQRLRSGILVLDGQYHVVFINESAATMLRVDGIAVGRSLELLAPALAEALSVWLNRRENRKTPLKTAAGSAEVIVSFTHLGDQESGTILVFLEDAAETQQRAQQLKLASLGRLTASIAHEIRNPLGAISHAGQLLAESPQLSREDLRLTEIIAEHSLRMNDIIKNVMLIGRREGTVAESFELRPWLEKFIAELCERRDLTADDLVCNWPDQAIIVRMDKSQLHQVLWNLCENALRYSTRPPLLTFECGLLPTTARPYIDVMDTGPGMSAAAAEQIFEPFFTGTGGGTGLGLYIARELCESNQTSLVLLEHGATGCRFRLHFAHPERQQLMAW